MRVRLNGVRGSTPAAGPEFVVVGGHTSSIAIAHDDGPWCLLVDAGTGLVSVTALLDDQPFRGSILLGHMHLDHTQGLPFFVAGDQPGSRVDIVVPAQEGLSAEALLDRCYSPPHFPIRLGQMKGAWSFTAIDAGVHEIEGFTVHAADIPHGGGRTLGYRISDGTSSIAYMSDHGPAAGDPDSLAPALALSQDVDAVFHDSHFTPDEQLRFADYGHSTPLIGVDLAIRAHARRLVLIHHAPRRSDEAVHEMGKLARQTADDLARAGKHHIDVVVGVEGMELEFP